MMVNYIPLIPVSWTSLSWVLCAWTLKGKKTTLIILAAMHNSSHCFEVLKYLVRCDGGILSTLCGLDSLITANKSQNSYFSHLSQ